MLQQYDKLYVVSDLHLGGPEGERIFREAPALKWLVEHATNDLPGQRVGLVLNGDIFDFLAYPDESVEFNYEAEARVMALAGDTELSPLFAALTQFLKTPLRTLIMQIGNHDIELALASVQNAVRKALGGTGDLHFETSGCGTACNVGTQRVFCVHGNGGDPWNTVDYHALAAYAEGQRGDPPSPNGGTTMVIQVLNAIKRQYPFVDLLKPEGAPLLAVLDAVDVKQSKRGLLRALKRVTQQRGGWSELLGSAPGELSGLRATDQQILEFLMKDPVPGRTSRQLLEDAELHAERGTSPSELVRDARGQLQAGKSYAAMKLEALEAGLDRLLGVPDPMALRLALARLLAADQTFSPTALSDIDRRIIESADAGTDVLIAGHTHLPRCVRTGAVTYLNTGTWMRVLRLDGTGYLDSDLEFERFFHACKQGSLTDLDALDIDPRARPVAVVDSTSASLLSVTAQSTGGWILGPLRSKA